MSSADCHPLDLFAANNLHEQNDKTWDILRSADDGSFPPPQYLVQATCTQIGTQLVSCSETHLMIECTASNDGTLSTLVLPT